MRFLGQPPSVLVATLATLTALIFQLISLASTGVFGVIAPISAGTACFFLLMEFAFYADNVRKSNTLEHDYCFYLCIVAWILSFVAAVLLVDGRRRSSAADSGYTNVK
nr:hypothetical protein BaRGS_032428 [Batillaria attramentaria]